VTAAAPTLAILGGRGMLGTDLAAAARAAGYNVRVHDLPEFDLTRPDHVAAALQGAEAVVNCAAFTNVDLAEDKPDAAFAVNGTAVGVLGRLCRERGLHLVHISTDFVFDGEGTRFYTEDDPPHPVCVYGASKLAGEQALADSGAEAAILRVEWSYGRNGVNFITKFLDRARKGGELKVVADQVGSPTWTADMAPVILALLKGRRTGLYHFANAGHASRYEVARFIAQHVGLANPILPCSSDEFPMKARRPKNSRFNLARIQAILDTPIRPWQDALARFLSAETKRGLTG
jgi:dTDP-4-dehydrorhamnose reductase